MQRTEQLPGSVMDTVIRYSLGLMLLIVSYDDVMNFSVLEGYLSLASLPREILLSVTGAQIIGGVLLFKGIRTPLTAALLAINSAISAECFSSDFSWVMMAGFLALALHSRGKDNQQRRCGPAMK